MNRHGKVLAAVTAMAIILGSSAFAAGASRDTSAPGHAKQEKTPGNLPKACKASAEKRGPTTEIATAKLIIEYNSTDEDLGVHGAFDDHGWKTLCVFDPTGRAVLEVGPTGNYAT